MEGAEVYVGTGAVEATRYNQDTLVLLTTRDAENTEAPLVRPYARLGIFDVIILILCHTHSKLSKLNAISHQVSGPGSGRAVVVKGVGGRVSSLLHHAHEGAASLNYKRALASLLTPAHHDADLTYYSQVLYWSNLSVMPHFTSRSSTSYHRPFNVLGSLVAL